MNTVTIYSLEICPICEIVKEQLREMGIPFIDKDMSSSDNIAELALNGVYTMNAPVIEISVGGSKKYFYDDLLDDDNLKDEIYKNLILCI